MPSFTTSHLSHATTILSQVCLSAISLSRKPLDIWNPTNCCHRGHFRETSSPRCTSRLRANTAGALGVGDVNRNDTCHSSSVNGNAWTRFRSWKFNWISQTNHQLRKKFNILILIWDITLRTSYRTERQTVKSNGESLTIWLLLQPSVTGVTISLLVSGLTVDILSTFCCVFYVNLMLRNFEFGVLLFNCFLYRQNLTRLKCFTRYGHYASEVEDIIIGRLAVVS